MLLELMINIDKVTVVFCGAVGAHVNGLIWLNIIII